MNSTRATGAPSHAAPVTTPGPCLRFAAAGSLALGLLVVLGLPVLVDAAFYVGLIAGALAACATVGGARLWRYDTLVARAGVALAVVPILIGSALALFWGLPGASEVAASSALGPAGALGIALVVLVLLLTDVLRRTADHRPKRPYAL